MNEPRTKPAAPLSRGVLAPFAVEITGAVEAPPSGGYRAADDERGELVIALRPLQRDWVFVGALGGMLTLLIVAIALLSLVGELGVLPAVGGFVVMAVIIASQLRDELSGKRGGTTVTVAHRRLTVRYGRFTAHSLDALEVKRVFVQRDPRAGDSDRFEVLALKQADASVVLLRSLSSLEQAQRVARAIEEHLRITDVPVAGEEPKR